jgi:hypothetical protein
MLTLMIFLQLPLSTADTHSMINYLLPDTLDGHYIIKYYCTANTKCEVNTYLKR